MEHKTWLWRKRPSEKIIAVNDKCIFPSKGTEQERNVDKAKELEISLKGLNERLSSALNECDAKDDLVMKHIKVAEEAISGWEKAEEAAAYFKSELDNAMQQKIADEERISCLDTSLKECMQQLRFIREEQEKRIHDVLLKVSKEFEEVRISLEEKLAEASKQLIELSDDNCHLNKVLQVKGKLIEDFRQYRSEVEADFDALKSRLDSTVKENSSLKYEVCMLEKELEMKNEEGEFNRKSVDASHKLHLESMKKIAKLETECQRLRLLVRKRLPGPAALANMRNEVEILGRDSMDMRKMKSTVTKDIMLNPDSCYSSPTKRINHLIERLCGMEDENKILRETLSKKNCELQSSRAMCARTASKLQQVETQLSEISQDQTGLELSKSMPVASYEMNLASISEDVGNEDDISSSESWASALISELEHFKNVKPKELSCRSSGLSDLSLMDDFVEMERLAIVSLDKPPDRKLLSDESKTFVLVEDDSKGYLPNETSKEIVPIADNQLGHSNHEMQSKYRKVKNYPSWIHDIWGIIVQQGCISQVSLHDIIEYVQVALMNLKHSARGEDMDTGKSNTDFSVSDPSSTRGYVSWKPSLAFPLSDSSEVACVMNTSPIEICNQQFYSKLNVSISKVIGLIESIKPSLSVSGKHDSFLENTGNSSLCKMSGAPTGYIVRVFQWRSSELGDVLQNFIQTCNDLLNGKAGIEAFAGELTSTLDWILNHCFSLQDVSSMKDMIKNHFQCDEMHSESEHEVEINIPRSGIDKLDPLEECKHPNEASALPLSSWSGQSILPTMGTENELKAKDGNRSEDKEINLESGKNEFEERIQSTASKNEELIIQLQESERSMTILQVETTKLKELKGFMENQIDSHKLMNDDLYAQLTASRIELNEARQKFSSLELEFDGKRNCCEELEAKCLDLQLQLESVANKDSSHMVEPDHSKLRTGWEISAASEKLAECQETILNLGKQLKALASPRDEILLDKVITTSSPVPLRIYRRPSLLDQMLAEDDAKVDEINSPKTKEIICTGDPTKVQISNVEFMCGQNVSHLQNDKNTTSAVFRVSPDESSRPFHGSDETKVRGEASAASLALVTKRRKGGAGLWRKLLMRRKGTCKQELLAIGA